jgi:general secretion pathway protein D
VLKNNIKDYLGRFSLVAVVGLIVVSCAHESTVQPSKGHIDGKPTTSANDRNATTAPIPKLVRSSPQLPPPKATTKAQTYSVVVNEVPVKEILFALARESKINIDIHPAIQGRATLNAVDQTLPAILERLAKQVDLTYRMDGDVLYIAPDLPVLRNYKIDYVNMNRDTKSFIGADGQISSSAQVGDKTSTNGTGANNSSRTSVDSQSKNHLWESLIQNIKDLLAETDKEVIVTRIGTAGQSDTQSNNQLSGATNIANTQSDAAKAAAEEREREKTEYKTLFAANVIANAETGVISVRATNKQHEKVQEFIDKVMGSARRQVLIEATIVQVTLNDGYQAGIDWSRLGQLGSSGFVFSQVLGPQLGAVTSAANVTNNGSGIVAGYVNGNRGILSSIQLLQQFGDTKVLSSPKLMVLNNQTAVMKVVTNKVYFTVQAQQSQGSVGGGILSTVTTTPNTVPVGLVMSVTPQISDAGSVNLNVRPTITSTNANDPLDNIRDPNPTLPLSIPSIIPVIHVSEMESMLQVDSGKTAVLGGLMQDTVQRTTEKVPGLASIPGLGKLFTGRNDLNQKTELVIFLRPTVVPNASLESDELQSYKQYLPEQQLQNVLKEAN